MHSATEHLNIWTMFNGSEGEKGDNNSIAAGNFSASLIIIDKSPDRKSISKLQIWTTL